MSENYENVATQNSNSPEVELDLNDLMEEKVNPELGMTTGQKIKTLLARPLWSAIIKWVFILFGIVGAVLYLIANNDSRETGESIAKLCSGFKNLVSSIFGAIPISVFEILLCAIGVGILAYLIYIVVRCIQIKGLFHKLGLWVQFLYSVLAVACVLVLLFSMCYGVYGYRQKLSKISDNAYSSADVTNQEFTETMLYLIDNLNNTLSEGRDDQIWFTMSGFSQPLKKGDSLQHITSEVNKAFNNAAKKMEELKGPAIKSKELLFTPLYTSNRTASVYSPITGEVCINPEYPDVFLPMQIAKTIAMQRGFTDSDTAEFIAFIVCTQYSDNLYLNYSGYFNAYVSLSSELYRTNGKDLHLYLANSLHHDIKKEFVNVVKKLDTLYEVSSDLNFIPAEDKLSSKDYNDAAKLLLENYRSAIDQGTVSVDNTEYVDYGDYCNYLTNFYKLDADFQDAVDEVYEEYHPED